MSVKVHVVVAIVLAALAFGLGLAALGAAVVALSVLHETGLM